MKDLSIRMVQESPADLFDQVDEQVRELLLRLFPEPSLNGCEFLQQLCRVAHEQEVAFGQASYRMAVVTFQSIPAFVQQPGWKWSRETTLKMFQLLEMLSLLFRRRQAHVTEILLPLGKRRLNKADMLARLDHCPYKNKKTRQLVTRLRKDLRQSHFAFEDEMPSQGEEQHEEQHENLHQLLSALLSVLQQEQVAFSRRNRIIHWVTQTLVPALTAASPKIAQPTASSLPHAETDLVEMVGVASSRQTGPLVAALSRSVGQNENRPAIFSNDPQGDFCVPKTPAPSMNIEEISIAQENNLKLKERYLEFETCERQSGDLRTEVSANTPDAERLWQEEARYLWCQLYTVEQREAPDGRHLINGFQSRLRERPDLVRAAMINVLMQRVFPDRYGVPNDGGSRWFYRTYALYEQGKLPISPEIASWATSPYSYQQIEQALQAEEKRQERYWERPTRPFASCVEAYGLLTAAAEEVEEESASSVSLVSSQTPNVQVVAEKQDGDDDRQDRGGHERVVEGDLVQPTEVSEPFTEDAATEAEPPMQDVILVEQEQMGWQEIEQVWWWLERLQGTPVLQEHTVEVLPTQYGRYVMVMGPHDPSETEWIWWSGRQIREYVDTVRLARTK